MAPRPRGAALSLKGRIRGHLERPADKRRYVRGLFGRIAGRYDLTNDVMSLGLHRRWKRRLVELAQIEPGHAVLDLAAGTGDLALASLSRAGPRGRVVAADLTPEMMAVGAARREGDSILWTAADALELPFADESFDRVLIGYGLRNFPDLERSLREIRRCLRPGGRLATLDFGKPANPALRRLYLAYLDASTTLVGWLLHRDREAYLYIPESLRAYPSQREVADLMHRAGFRRCLWVDVLAGSMAIHVADRA
jgi:demethylmenaquinone methyltransferase/2-methoxy-6-polyprenyl-1,4-benzoquinol methylase